VLRLASLSTVRKGYKMKYILGLLIAACTITGHTAFKDGNRLLNDMNDSSTVGQMVALGYVIGVTDSFSSIVHCAPSNVTAGQVRDMVKNFLVNQPQRRHQAADMLVLEVLVQAWPCPKHKRSGA
jgi:hypothetical protein